LLKATLIGGSPFQTAPAAMSGNSTGGSWIWSCPNKADWCARRTLHSVLLWKRSVGCAVHTISGLTCIHWVWSAGIGVRRAAGGF